MDRLLINGALVVWDLFTQWVPYMVAEHASILVALDWMDYEGMAEATLAIW